MNGSGLIKGCLVAVSLTVLSIGAVWADHRHGHGRVGVGVYVGPSFFWGGYPSPYYYPPYAPVVIERSPPVYIEQSPPPPVVQTNYWFYCAASRAYYPYVNECPGGWQRVLPQPPSTR